MYLLHRGHWDSQTTSQGAEKFPCTILLWASGIQTCSCHSSLQKTQPQTSVLVLVLKVMPYRSVYFSVLSKSYPGNHWTLLLKSKKIVSAENVLSSLCQTEFESRLPCWCLFSFQGVMMSVHFWVCGTWCHLLFPISVPSNQAHPRKIHWDMLTRWNTLYSHCFNNDTAPHVKGEQLCLFYHSTCIFG